MACTDIVIEGMLMPLLARFRRRHPQVQLQLAMNPPLASPARSEADVAVRAAAKAPARLPARRVGQIEPVLCASRAYLRSHDAGQPLDRHRWVIVVESPGPDDFERWFRQQMPAARIVASVDSLVGAADAVAAGLGIGFVPRPLVAARPELVPLAATWPPPQSLQSLHWPIWVSMHPDVQHTARARALFQFLVEGLAAPPQLGR